MSSPRDVLNRLKWSDEPQATLEGVEVWYVHRGAPRDTRIVKGTDIVVLGRSFFEVEGAHGRATIPYHRIFRITSGHRILFVRRGAERAAPRDEREQG